MNGLVTKQKTILLADDDPNDIYIVQTAFQRAGYDVPFVVVRNGEDAISYMKGKGRFADRKEYPFPSLLLLDLKMPSVDGFEVLSWIRSHPVWRTLPIIVLTNSHYGPDINRAYDLGANSFLTKPSDFYDYVGAVKQIAHFWLMRNVSPELGPFISVEEEPADLDQVSKSRSRSTSSPDQEHARSKTLVPPQKESPSNKE